MQETTTHKRHMRLGGCGSGKISQGKDGVHFQMPLGDKTFIEVATTAAGGEEDDVSKFKTGTMYMMCKELSKSLTSPLTMSGFKIEPKVDGPAGGGHGYTLTHESDWSFYPKDKNVTTWTSGNILRDVALNIAKLEFLPGIEWLWRFQWEPIHGKLTVKKPFLILTQCLT